MTPTDTLREAAATEACVYAIEAAGWRVVNEGTHLPCKVDLPPATTIGAGCRLGTLLDALEHRGMAVAYQSALTAAQARIAELEGALKPFAAEARLRANLALGPDIDHWPIGGSNLTLGDLRIAAATLSPAVKEPK